MTAFPQPIGMRNRDAVFMQEKLSRYPWLAQAPTSIKPPNVPDFHFVSARVREGWRVWGFETEQERDTFIVQFGGRNFP